MAQAPAQAHGCTGIHILNAYSRASEASNQLIHWQVIWVLRKIVKQKLCSVPLVQAHGCTGIYILNAYSRASEASNQLVHWLVIWVLRKIVKQKLCRVPLALIKA